MSDQGSDCDENSDDDELNEKDNEKIQKATKPREVNFVRNSFQPHEINHFTKESYSNYSCGNGNFRYMIDNAQYVIANSDQVKVKYIIQIKKI